MSSVFLNILIFIDPKADTMMTDANKTKDDMKTNKQVNQQLPVDAQPQTIADFIIHPLIALKPRLPEVESGKQAEGSTTTPSPWQLFGFNPGQGLGSSVSSLAGSVTGWLGNRIQLPGLVDTPVRESTTTTTTTTTTTPKPDIVVRVKQRASTRKPLISIDNSNNYQNRPNRRNKKPLNNNQVDDSAEEDDSQEFDEDDDFHRRRYPKDDDEDDDDDEGSNEHDEEEDDEEDEGDDDEEDEPNHDDEDEEEEEHRPVMPQRNRRRQSKPLNHKRRSSANNNNQRRRVNNRKRQPQQHQEESAEEEQVYDDDQDFYYNKNQGSKRSQNEQNFIQRGQQSLLNQIRHFTRGQTPAQVGNTLRKSTKSNKKTKGKKGTLIINRNGQTIYVAPELLQVADEANNGVTATTQSKRPISNYPQPPLTVPYRRKGQPTQYITIPWSQLGISPPDEIVSVTEGIQSKPLILNIPQSAIESMQSFKPTKKKPVITAEAVPLLAEASIMDIFKPPRIPPARSPTTTKPTKKVALTGTPVVIATKTKPGPARIRPATIVEKAPPVDDNKEEKKPVDEKKDEDDDDEDGHTHLIVIGDESGETELSRQAYHQILEYFNQKRIGRELKMEDEAAMEAGKTGEQLIPVQIVTETEQPAVADNMEMVMDMPKEAEMKEEVKEDKAEMMMESVPEMKEEVKEDKPEMMMESAADMKEEVKDDKAEMMMEA